MALMHNRLIRCSGNLCLIMQDRWLVWGLGGYGGWSGMKEGNRGRGKGGFALLMSKRI